MSLSAELCWLSSTAAAPQPLYTVHGCLCRSTCQMLHSDWELAQHAESFSCACRERMLKLQADSKRQRERRRFLSLG